MHEAHEEETRDIGRRFVGKPDGKGLLGRPWERQIVYSNESLEMGCEGVG